MGEYHPKVYLSGPIENAEDSRSWREEMQEEYELYNYVDPHNYGFDEHLEEGVMNKMECEAMYNREMREVRQSDILYVKYIEGMETWGTPMEVKEAYENDVPIVVESVEVQTPELPNFLISTLDYCSKHRDMCLSKGRYLAKLR